MRVLPPGGMVDTKRTRGTNVIELQAVADPRTGTAIVAGALDNLVKGAAGQAIQNFNLCSALDEETGLADGGGLPVSVTYPRGFRAAGITRRSEAERPPDLGAPGRRSRAIGRRALHDERGRGGARRYSPARRLQPGSLERCVVNSGQANAATGDRGRRRRGTAVAAAAALGVEPDDVLACSTGVIGEPLHIDELIAALPTLVGGALGRRRRGAFASAIMTTDTVAKQATAERGAYRVGGCAKGVGMIAPDLPRHDARVRHDRRGGPAAETGTPGRRHPEAPVRGAHRRRVHQHERHGPAVRERGGGRRRRSPPDPGLGRWWRGDRRGGGVPASISSSPTPRE